MLRSFDLADPTIAGDSIALDGDAWRIVGGAAPRTFRLFEVREPGVERCMLTYRARLKTEGVERRAYLEMWCRLPGRGEFFSKGFQQAALGTNAWADYEIPFYLKRGQKADLIQLDLTLEGAGTVWIKDVQLLHTPLRS
ncbi:hypothetical protein [Thiocystis violascens]|nr:hypothetical protein [Thiocystis violascens]